jgi:Glycosyltransferases involved in cell wall biogenesis
MELSVVIPTYNRPKPLKNCLEALRAQETNLDWEIVLVNDGGHIDEDLESYFSDLPLRLFHTENRGPGHARNYGVKQAAGHKIAFIDDDCQAGPNWLNHMARALRPRRLVAGQ